MKIIVSVNSIFCVFCISYFSNYASHIPHSSNRKGLLWFTTTGNTVHYGREDMVKEVGHISSHNMHSSKEEYSMVIFSTYFLLFMQSKTLVHETVALLFKVEFIHPNYQV